MLANINQQVNPQKSETPLTELPDAKKGLAVPVCGKENINQFRKNKNLPGICEQLPHHCIQLCFLS